MIGNFKINPIVKTILFFLFYLTIIISCKKQKDVILSPPEQPKVPKLITNPVSDLTLFSAVLSGKVVDTGGSRLIEAGLLVDTFPMPTTTKNVNKFVKQPDNNGEFTTTVISIPANKTWYLRAYGINAQGTGYGNEVKFTSLPEKVFFGNVTLTTQQELAAFGANNYTTIRGSLYIWGPVTDLSPLSNLVIVGNGFEAKNTALTNFNGLQNLEIIGEDFIHSVRIENNPLLTSFSGLNKLKISQGYFYILNNDALTNLSGLDSYTTFANGEFRIEGCDNLTSIYGLEKMQLILGSIMLKDNPVLSDLRAWSNLTTVIERIRIINNPSLHNLDGFEKIKQVEGVELIDNPVLTNIMGLRNLVTITDVINIDNNDALSDMLAFNNIITVEFINIKNNAALTDLQGLKNLQTLKYKLLIENNPMLTNMRGLERLKSLSSLEIFSNSSLINLTGLDSLTSLINNSYSITVAYNNQLQSLNGLQKLTTAQGSVQIFTNPSLTDFCALKPLFVAGYNGFFYVEFNGTNPTITQVINTCP